MIISLWMCKNAKYPSDDEYVSCSKGHNIGRIRHDMVKKGNPLICMACQSCPDSDIMGNDLKKEERGW